MRKTKRNKRKIKGVAVHARQHLLLFLNYYEKSPQTLVNHRQARIMKRKLTDRSVRKRRLVFVMNGVDIQPEKQEEYNNDFQV